MEYTKVLAAGVVVLLAAGGVAATGASIGAQSTTAASATNVDAQATYDNGTVTVVVTDAGEALENVSVYVDDETVGTTDANGTVVFETNATDELELELVGSDFEGELSYVVQNDSLALVEESYEYERADGDDEEETESEGESDESDEESDEEERESESDDEDADSDDEEAEPEDDEAETESTEEQETDDDDEAGETTGDD